MAKQTFKNEGGQTSIQLAGDAEPVVIGPGESYSTDNEELKTAFRKSGQFSKASSSKEKS